MEGATALMYSAINGNLNAVKWLLSNGSNINLQNKARETALNYAIRGGQIDVVNFLKKYAMKQNKL